MNFVSYISSDNEMIALVLCLVFFDYFIRLFIMYYKFSIYNVLTYKFLSRKKTWDVLKIRSKKIRKKNYTYIHKYTDTYLPYRQLSQTKLINNPIVLRNTFSNYKIEP